MTPEQASQKFHWVKYDEANKVIELYCDHHMLSTLRTCEAKFQLEHILNIRPRSHKAYNLVFGAWFHECLELFYNSIKLSPKFQPLDINDFLSFGKKQWIDYNLNAYSDEDQFEKMGGFEGALSLLVQYYAFYMDLRVRIIDTEIAFGFNKEVPLGSFQIGNYLTSLDLANFSYKEYFQVNCYLTGRIDLLIDNGHKIGIVDHKTHASFRGDEWRKFNPQDGITGYIFAVNALMKNAYPAYFEQGKTCRSGWIYHVSKGTPSVNRKTKVQGPRFKVTCIDKSDSQLEEYRLRQLETFKVAADLIFNNKVPQWSTSACGNIYARPCEYINIHETQSEAWSDIIKNFYQITEPWNPLSPDNSLLKRDKVLEASSIKESDPAGGM